MIKRAENRTIKSQMKTLKDIFDERSRLVELDMAKNGKIYPEDSLHSMGFPSPTCPTCAALAALEWVIGTNRRKTADIMSSELVKARKYSILLFEDADVPEADINNPSW